MMIHTTIAHPVVDTISETLTLIRNIISVSKYNCDNWTYDNLREVENKLSEVMEKMKPTSGCSVPVTIDLSEVRVGDIVKIGRLPTEEERSIWLDSWLPKMDNLVNQTGIITSLRLWERFPTVQVTFPNSGEYYYFPYSTLEYV